MVTTHIRNANLQDLAQVLKDQQAAKVDVVAPATTLEAQDSGLILVRGAEAQLTDEGVTDVDGLYRPTVVFQEGVADKLGIPIRYVHRMHEERPDLWAANINAWLHGSAADGIGGTLFDPDPRSFLFRGFTAGTQEHGIARALLSDRYAMIDNLDVITAALEGIRKAGVPVEIPACDLTDRNMYVRITAPGVIHNARSLLRGYRNPFDDPTIGEQRNRLGFPAQANFGYGPVDDPVIFAGLELRNSEVGGGAFTITPRAVIRVCTNGMTIAKDAVRAVHLGKQLEDGVVRWSDETRRKTLELITARAADAVTTFLDRDYLAEQVEAIEEKAGKRVSDAPAVVKRVGKALGFDEMTQAGILDHFIHGGQMTAGGVFQAVTSYAQVVPDADRARDLEVKALLALDHAAA